MQVIGVVVIAMKACHSEQKFNEVEFAKNPPLEYEILRA